jgi:hypothetical protein
MMQVLADFAAMGVRQQRQQRMLVEHASAAAAAAMANELAHKINSPTEPDQHPIFGRWGSQRPRREGGGTAGAR